MNHTPFAYWNNCNFAPVFKRLETHKEWGFGGWTPLYTYQQYSDMETWQNYLTEVLESVVGAYQCGMDLNVVMDEVKAAIEKSRAQQIEQS